MSTNVYNPPFGRSFHARPNIGFGYIPLSNVQILRLLTAWAAQRTNAADLESSQNLIPLHAVESVVPEMSLAGQRYRHRSLLSQQTERH